MRAIRPEYYFRELKIVDMWASPTQCSERGGGITINFIEE
jgi:hypothetical protein